MAAKRFAVAVLALACLSAPLLGQETYKPLFKGDPAHSRSEAAALGYMRTVVDAQRAYKKRHQKYATSLQQLVNNGSFTRRMLKTDRGDYSVAFRAPAKDRYSVQLTPKTFDAEHRAFYVEENGTIRVEPDKPATADSPVLHPDQ
jgi:type II secretory pathway pseudopilin PulG